MGHELDEFSRSWIELRENSSNSCPIQIIRKVLSKWDTNWTNFHEIRSNFVKIRLIRVPFRLEIKS
jgi:hypothetical protein